MKHEETAALAQAAFRASGCDTHEQFVALFGEDVIGLRSFRYWLSGDRAAAPIARLLLREFAAGWRPTL